MTTKAAIKHSNIHLPRLYKLSSWSGESSYRIRARRVNPKSLQAFIRSYRGSVIVRFTGIRHLRGPFQYIHFQRQQHIWTHLGRPLVAEVYYRPIPLRALYWQSKRATLSMKIDLTVKVGSVISWQKDFPIESDSTTLRSIDFGPENWFTDDTEHYLTEAAISTVEILSNPELSSFDRILILEEKNMFQFGDCCSI